MKNKRARKVLGVSSTIYIIGAIFILMGIIIIGSNTFLALTLIVEGLFLPGLIGPIIAGQAELIEKASSIEELLKNNILPQEDILNKNVYSISQSLYTKNNYNDEFEDQLAVNKKILDTLKSIDEKMENKEKNMPKKAKEK